MSSSTRILLPEATAGLRARTLFYPAAGRDWRVPLDSFMPWATDFWFVDANPRAQGNVTPKLILQEVTEETVTGRTIRTGEPFTVDVRHRRYRTPTGGVLTIHKCTGRGYDAFRSIFSTTGRKLSVFFHRGDSPGEGGSNFRWLGSRRIRNVLAALETGGLIVSDGSLSVHWLRRRYTGLSPTEIVTAAGSFEYAAHRFTCVGYLGMRYGPTLVWKTSAC